MSVVLRVCLLNDSPPDCKLRGSDNAILKLYDRRFAVGMRISLHFNGKEFDQELEDRYVEYLRSFNFDCGNYQETQNTPNSVIEATPTDVETEADIQLHCLKLEELERDVYRRLHHLQGDQIPYYHAEVELVLDPHLPGLKDLSDEHVSVVQGFLRVPGALIEYIDGWPLREIRDFVPKDDWRYVIQSAINTVNERGEYGVLNSDMRTDNILVQRLPARFHEGIFLNRVVHFDFAQAQIRREAEDDFEWKRNKW